MSCALLNFLDYKGGPYNKMEDNCIWKYVFPQDDTILSSTHEVCVYVHRRAVVIKLDETRRKCSSVPANQIFLFLTLTDAYIWRSKFENKI